LQSLYAKRNALGVGQVGSNQLALIEQGPQGVVLVILGSLLEVVTAFLLYANGYQKALHFISISKSREHKSSPFRRKAKLTLVRGKDCKKNNVKRSISTSVQKTPHSIGQIELEAVQSLIETSKLKPTTRAIRDQFKVGSKTTCEILKSLEQNGVLVSLTRGYALAS